MSYESREERALQERVLAGRYRLQEKVGSGGMAEVYRAIDDVLGRTVAVKIMHEQLAGDPTWAERFRREARAAASLHNQHIVTVYDWGHDENADFIVMEFVDGEDLGSLIRREGALPVARVADIGYQAADALVEAHSQGVIHRDVSPGNILVGRQDSAKVADFGIARVGSTILTQTGSVLGSASYVSPEQAQGLGATPASDLYSLGVVLFQAATGRLPFEAESTIALAYKHVNEPPPMPHDLVPEIDERLDAIIGKAIQKAPEDRYHSAIEMREALRGLSEAGSVSAVPPSASAVRDESRIPKTAVMRPVAATAAGTSPVLGSPPTGRRRSLRAALPWLLLAVLVVAVGWGLARCAPAGRSTVPRLTGLTLAQAAQRLESAELQVTELERQASSTASGTVIAQDPPEGTRVAPGTGVTLTVSSGPVRVQVPRITGLREAAARDAIEEAGLTPVRGDPRYSSHVAEGRVVAQTPLVGQPVTRGTRVTYVLSRGPRPAPTPDPDGNQPRPDNEGKGKGKDEPKGDKKD